MRVYATSLQPFLFTYTVRWKYTADYIPDAHFVGTVDSKPLALSLADTNKFQLFALFLELAVTTPSLCPFLLYPPIIFWCVRLTV